MLIYSLSDDRPWASVFFTQLFDQPKFIAVDSSTYLPGNSGMFCILKKCFVLHRFGPPVHVSGVFHEEALDQHRPWQGQERRRHFPLPPGTAKIAQRLETAKK